MERGLNMNTPYLDSDGKVLKQPKEMVNIELLEMYSHYNRMSFRLEKEQDYIGLLRREILKRMEQRGK